MVNGQTPLLNPVIHAWMGSARVGFTQIIGGFIPQPPAYFTVSGTTKDSNGAALASCVVALFRTSDDVKVDQVTSGADGSFAFTTGAPATSYYVVAYKPGSPDVTGATANTIAAV